MMPFDDRGLTLGDGLFETILARDGELVLLDEHIARMQAGCMALGLPAPDAGDVRGLCLSVLAESDLAGARAAVRLTLTAGSGGRGLDRPTDPEPHIFATIAASPRPAGPVALVTSEVRRNEGSPAARLKTLSYVDNVLARRVASPAEALMLNNAGELACAAAANIFWMRGGRLFTPSTGCGALDGIMRRQVMAAIEVEAVRAPRAMLEGAEAIFLTNSLIGVRPVASLDGVNLRSHPVVETLAATLKAVS
jgi:branched-chain amino acid aminotransferase/4-amino-4-deoxychorismate lyase